MFIIKILRGIGSILSYLFLSLAVILFVPPILMWTLSLLVENPAMIKKVIGALITEINKKP
jgi:hypothetical protein